MSGELVQARVGDVTIDIPRACARRCIELKDLRLRGRAGRGLEGIKQYAEESAVALGRAASKSCTGPEHTESESGIFWADKCPIADLVIEHN